MLRPVQSACEHVFVVWRTIATGDQVRQLLADGVAKAEIARRLGVSKGTVS